MRDLDSVDMSVKLAIVNKKLAARVREIRDQNNKLMLENEGLKAQIVEMTQPIVNPPLISSPMLAEQLLAPIPKPPKGKAKKVVEPVEVPLE